ncbi:MAG: hypothetical protein IE909_10595, partial [Campylobacterales bacterium]|nr:hypothetical protein [Campylobacterales bacterium]
QTITKNLSDFEEFGEVEVSTQKVQTAGGVQKQKTFWLNEQQATLLMTYLRNSEVVRKFKKILVREFYIMKDTIQNNTNLKELYGRIGGLVKANQDYREYILRLEDMLKQEEQKRIPHYDSDFLRDDMSLNEKIDFLIRQTEKELKRDTNRNDFMQNRANFFVNYIKVMREGGSELQRFVADTVEDALNKRREAQNQFYKIEEKYKNLHSSMEDCCKKINITIN